MGVEDIYKVSRIAEARSIQRAITVSVLAKIKNVEEVNILKQNWPRDEHAMLLLRGAVSPTSTTSASAISHDQIGAFRSIAPGSAALSLFDRSVKLDLTGINTVRVPRVANLPPQPVFVVEGQPAPAVQFTDATITLGPACKIETITAVSKELNLSMPETAVSVVGRIVADACTASIDKAAFDTTASSTARPAGLLYNVTPIGASTASDSAMADDLGNLVQAIGNAGIDPTDAIFVAGPREAMIINTRIGPNFKSQVLVTLGLPAKSVAAFAPAAIYSGYQGLPIIETSDSAAFHYEDTTPKEIVSTPGVVAAPVKSLYQTDTIAIKVRAWCSWAVIPGGAQVVNSVNW
jgi:hypothetical protein